jgi:signal transduction histidine kinase
VQERPIEPIKLGTQIVVTIGFGGLLAMLAITGIDSLSVLVKIRALNFENRQKFLARDRALDQIRAGLYLSGSSAQDYLLERDPAAAEGHRATMQSARKTVDGALASYARSIAPGQMSSFRSLEQQIQSYWNTLDPIFHWDARQKQARSESFLDEDLLPRRTATLRIADRIADLNEREMTANNQELADIFNSSRARLILVLAVTLTFGVVLAAGATVYLVRLARDAEARFREIMKAQQELKDLSARLVEMQEKERRTISRELHDEVGQSLSAVLMEIGNLNAVLPADNPELHTHLNSIRNLAENSVKVVRNMSLLLRPSMLDDLGLLPALQWQAREVGRRTGIEVDVVAENVADDLPEDHKTCIYRVVQEALHNCAEHSGARSVRLTVIQHPGSIAITIQDDGRGFDSGAVRGMGLLGMEERVTHLGGAFHVNSKPGQGATLHVELPLDPGAVRASA